MMKFGSKDRRLASCVAQGRFGVVEIGTPSRGGRIRLTGTAERGREPEINLWWSRKNENVLLIDPGEVPEKKQRNCRGCEWG